MSTATEHAPKDADASTDDVSLRPLTGIPRSSASEDGHFLGNDAWSKIVALLLWMAQGFHPKISAVDILDAVLEALIKCTDAKTGGTLGLLHTASIAKLSEVIDIMMLHKDGSPKDANTTLQFMKRAARIRKELLTTASDNATERVELDEDDVSKCHQLLGRNLITHDLLPHQLQGRHQHQYRLRNNYRGDTYLSTFQRSLLGLT